MSRRSKERRRALRAGESISNPADSLVGRCVETILLDMAAAKQTKAPSLGDLCADYCWPPYWDEIVSELQDIDINFDDDRIDSLIQRSPNDHELRQQVEHKLIVTQEAAYQIGLAIGRRLAARAEVEG